MEGFDCGNCEYLCKGQYRYERCDKFFPDYQKLLETSLSEEEIKDSGVDLIEKHFPKDKCKERGAALVLYAELVIRIIERLAKKIKT